MSHQLGITLTQRPVPDKTSEIPIASWILEAFDVAGTVVATDALLTQRKFCQDLCDADADYVMPVKDNQHKLLEDIRFVLNLIPQTSIERHLNRHLIISVHTQILAT